MARVAYNASKRKFMDDWDTNQFMDRMCEGAALNHIGGSFSERNSWEANAARLRSLLYLSNLPDDVEVAFEYKCPLIRPFFMEVLRLIQDQKITADDALRVFEITENYLFRRNICEVPTNALNKIFLNLNKDIYRYDNTPDGYVEKFIYALLSKKESGRFPDDKEFTEALENKAVYQMRGKYKAYLFERLENYGTIEAKDVYKP